MNTTTLELTPTILSAKNEAAPSVRPAWSLWAIFSTYRWRILFTYSLFNLENLLRLAQPFVFLW